MPAVTDWEEHDCLTGIALADACSQHSIINASFCGIICNSQQQGQRLSIDFLLTRCETTKVSCRD